MATNPADIQWDDAPAAATPSAPPPPTAAPAAATPPPGANDVEWDPSDGTIERSKATDAPIIIAAVRTHPQEVNPTTTEAGFNSDLHPDAQYHTALSDADKAEYRTFFKDPANPPSAAKLGLWYHQKTGAYLANAQDIVDAFKRTGKFQTQEQIAIPTKHQNAGAAYTNHAANAVAGDYGPEAAGVLDALGLGGKDRPSIWNSDGSLRDLWANNADLERGQLERDSADHPIASIAGELTGAGLAAPVAGGAADALGAAKLAEDAPVVASAAKAAGGGAVYGSGAAGPGNRGEGAIAGAAMGAGTDVAAPYVIKAIPAIGKAIADATAPAAASPEAVAAAKGAQDLGIILPKFALSDKDRAAAGALEQTTFGRGPIKAGRNAMLDTSEAARNQVANDLGTAPETAAQLGDQVGSSAVAANKARRAAAGNLYQQANAAAGNVLVPATETAQTIQDLISKEGEGLGSKVAPILQSFSQQLQDNNGFLTIDGARATRTNLRNLLTNEAGATPSNADRITNTVMSSIGKDINNRLTALGRQDAIPLYQQADAAWKQIRATEDDVLKPFLGNNFDNWGEDVAKKINSDAKGNGTRLAQFLKSLPEDQANNTRASIIMGLGRSKDGAQNATGDAFSLSSFLTNWNQLSGAKRLIFAPETVQALDKLADVANVGKLSENERNFSKTGGVFSRLLMHGGEAGAGAALFTGHIKEAIASALFSGLMAARQYGAARLLASPEVAKRIAATPMNLKGAQAFWNRPAWLNATTTRNPAIAGEIQVFQQAVNDNLRQVQVAASNPDSPSQNKQPN